MRFFWCALVCIATAAQAAGTRGAARLSPRQAAAVDRAVALEMSRQEAVGVALGIIQNGQITYLKGYGLADRERREPITTRSIFNWASNSKPVGAVVAMQLWEKGHLDLDADIRTLVPEFPPKPHPINMRSLLCHHSGLPHYSNGKVLPNPHHPRLDTDREFADPVRALDLFSASPLLYPPGTKETYSTYGYLLVSAVVGRAARMNFFDLVQKRITRPLGMRSFQLDVKAMGQPNWTVGYGRENNQVAKVQEEANYWKYAGGGFKSNVEDFARWAQALLTHRLVSRKTEAAMWTVQPVRTGSAEFGLGFVVESERGTLKISHNGHQDETATRMVLYPGTASGMVLMSNSGHVKPGDITTAVYSALSGR